MQLRRGAGGERCRAPCQQRLHGGPAAPDPIALCDTVKGFPDAGRAQRKERGSGPLRGSQLGGPAWLPALLDAAVARNDELIAAARSIGDLHVGLPVRLESLSRQPPPAPLSKLRALRIDAWHSAARVTAAALEAQPAAASPRFQRPAALATQAADSAPPACSPQAAGGANPVGVPPPLPRRQRPRTCRTCCSSCAPWAAWPRARRMRAWRRQRAAAALAMPQAAGTAAAPSSARHPRPRWGDVWLAWPAAVAPHVCGLQRLVLLQTGRGT